MRIVAGRHRGRRLRTPEDQNVRPTSDRTRETLFNILSGGKYSEEGEDPLVGARVLDAFAGTGALGLEALSRGAAAAVFMEKSAAARNLCRANLKALGEDDRAEVVACDILRPPPASRACDLLLMDPPYHRNLGAEALAALDDAGWLRAAGLAVLELARRETFEPPSGFELLDVRTYGKTKLVFVRRGD